MAPPESQLDPSSFVAYSHAAAGHDGVRSDPTGAILIKPCTRAEISFYESTAAHPAFQPFMPTYMGTLTAGSVDETAKATRDAANAEPEEKVNSETQADQKAGVKTDDEQGLDWVPSGGKMLDTGLSIVLENVTTGFKKPNVVDLKLGARLWADDTPATKRRRLDEVSATTTSSSLGFRIAGMKVYRPSRSPDEVPMFGQHIEAEESGYLSYNKFYGRAFNDDDVRGAFVEFLGGQELFNDSQNRKEVGKRLSDKLAKLASVLEAEESRFYSASILVVYEGDEEALQAGLEQDREEAEVSGQVASDEDEEDDGQQKDKAYDMRMIDFAHAQWTPGQGPDENLLQGLRSVLKIFQGLAHSV